MFSMSRSTKKFHSWKCLTTVWRVIPLEIHFCCWLSLLLVTQIIKGKQLHLCFLTAMLITYIKVGTPAQIILERGVCNDESYICYFLTEVIKFYWLMLLLYTGELYRLLWDSSLLTLDFTWILDGFYALFIHIHFI